ncbi:hypothetical protein GV828_07485 [Flavobacterium sp. NST-5]|uniref:Uncharacterized protein n=1 Tax=Flavobacterium ichthyis TaxID=2698827 RepID=A0ABW9ZD74_9FLAO|nr:hypothetical protein [Flavobacterium ichthyis]NBL65040.1 hypothetical protein [Flavobacterium ichthyis]
MKKITLLALTFLFGNVAIANAFSGNFPMTVESAEPIYFNERGIEFYIFPNGEFDFNTVASSGGTYYKNASRKINSTYGAPETINFEGIKIEHDREGRVRRVGNVFVNYDTQNRVKRVGTVYMTYNRFALSRVGNLEIVYDRFGRIIDFRGNVKGYGNNYSNSNYYYGPSSGTNYYYRSQSNTRR